MKQTFKILLILFFISFPYEANAISPSPFIKAFKGLGKFFKKGADEVPDIGTKIEDLKGGSIKSSSKIDETISSVDNTNSIKFEEGTLSQIDNLSKDVQEKLTNQNVTDHDRYILNHKLETLKEISI